MMTLDVFLTLLLMVNIMTGLVTEGLKKCSGRIGEKVLFQYSGRSRCNCIIDLSMGRVSDYNCISGECPDDCNTGCSGDFELAVCHGRV